MAIKDDILAIAAEQDALFTASGKYAQVLPTPPDIPVKGDIRSIGKLRKPTDEVDEMTTVPADGDYQFRVDIWTQLHSGGENKGYTIMAKRDLGDGVIEVLTKNVGEMIVTTQQKAVAVAQV